MNLEGYLRAVPKAELHVHLEGSIQPDTLLILARRHGVTLPADNVAGLREWFTFRDFDHFIKVYLTINQCLRKEEDFTLIVYEFAREMTRQNVRYAEVTFSPGLHLWLGVPQEVYFPGLKAGREQARREFNVEINWVFDLVRNASRPERFNDYVTRVAIEGKTDGVVALGLGGKEAGYPPDPFAKWFDLALAEGLHSAPHAGEMVGPESIRGALDDLHAERIGHGVRAIESPELVARLAQEKIPLEISPTSNLCLGVYPSIDEHPFRRLYEAGVPVTVNSDDPPLFNTTLTDEILLLDTAFHFEIDTIDEILLNAVRYSFLPKEKKKALEAEFRAEMARLKHKR